MCKSADDALILPSVVIPITMHRQQNSRQNLRNNDIDAELCIYCTGIALCLKLLDKKKVPASIKNSQSQTILQSVANIQIPVCPM